MNNFSIDGFNDIIGEDFRKYDTIVKTIQNLMHNFGYNQVLTPTFEAYDMYDIDGVFSRQKMFKLIDNKGNILVLRPDATIPIARMVATNFKDENQIIKLGYITNIFRQYTSSVEFRKEFTQAGVEYFGNPLPACDAEIIALAIEILLNLSIKKIHIDLGNVSYINSLFEEINLETKKKKHILTLIDSKNMGELKSYLNQIKIDEAVSKIICEIPMLFGDFKNIIKKAYRFSINSGMISALEVMEKTYEIISYYGYGEYIMADLGFTNQFNYYSGLIFKGYINNVGEAVLYGGRYNNLSNKFGVSRPASGFGINISLLLDHIDSVNKNYFFDCLICHDEVSTNIAITTSKILREKGFSVNCINDYLNCTNKNNYKHLLYISKGNLYYNDKITTIDSFISACKED